MHSLFESRKAWRRLLCFVALAVLSLALPAGNASAATISRSATSGFVGSRLRITAAAGSFPVSSVGSFEFGSGTPFAVSQLVTSDNTGAMATELTVPIIPAGVYNIAVTIGTEVGLTSFSVRPNAVFSALIAKVGDKVSVRGTGFSPDATVNIVYGSTIVAQVTSSGNGAFPDVGFFVPAGTFGLHGVSATDGTNTVTAGVTVQASVTLVPGSGRVGDNITISGAGFNANMPVTLTFDASPVNKAITTSSAGAFTVTFQVPAVPSRSVEVAANDGLTSARANFSLGAAIRLSSTAVFVGASTGISGSGFGANRSVTISLDGTTVATCPTDASGTFLKDVTLPALSGGEHVVSARDELSVADARIFVAPQLTVDPPGGISGTRVTVTGTGFAGERRVAVSLDASPVTEANSDANGSFAAVFVAPGGAAGAHRLVAEDGLSSANTTFTAMASLALSRSSGAASSSLEVLGRGFTSDTLVSVRFGDTEVNRITTDSSGSFTGRLAVPQLELGDSVLTVSDGTNSATAVFRVTATVRIDPPVVNVGSTVTAGGQGLFGTVTVKYDEAVVATVVAGAEGSFSASFAVPASPHGNHSISVTDGTTTLQATLMMDSIPPSTPIGLMVKGASKSPRPIFVWSPVTDPSGVSYVLQVATDAGFSNIVLEKQGLATTLYGLQETESLKSSLGGDTFYWRVKAVDLASNESAFSTPGSLSVRITPTWAIWLLVAIGAVAAFLLALWAGSKIRPPASRAKP